MIKSLTYLEKKKAPNYVKQKNFLFCFCFVLFCFLLLLLLLLLLENWGIDAYFLTAKRLKRFGPSRLL